MKKVIFILAFLPLFVSGQKLIVSGSDTLAIVPIQTIQKANLAFNRVNYLEGTLKLTEDELRLCYESYNDLQDIETLRREQIEDLEEYIQESIKIFDERVKKQKKLKVFGFIGTLLFATLFILK